MSTTVVSIEMPNQQLQVDATVQRSPLVVLDQSVVSNPPAAKGLQSEALSDVWWSFRFRHVGHARLGYGSLPPAPLAEIAAGAAPYLLDPEGALDLSFDARFDAKGHRFLGGLFLAWIEDRSAFPASQLDVTPLEPPGSRIRSLSRSSRDIGPPSVMCL